MLEPPSQDQPLDTALSFLGITVKYVIYSTAIQDSLWSQLTAHVIKGYKSQHLPLTRREVTKQKLPMLPAEMQASYIPGKNTLD